MKTYIHITAALLCAFPHLTLADDIRPTQDYLWYKQPAGVEPATLPWSEADSESGNLPGKQRHDTWEAQSLPVGNGRIGGTIYGGDRRELVTLNEVSLWSGGPNLPGNGSGYAYGPLANKDQFGSYQPFGNLYIDFEQEGSSSNYSRSLDLRDGIARVSLQADGAEHQRECYVSEPDNVLVFWQEVWEPDLAPITPRV